MQAFAEELQLSAGVRPDTEGSKEGGQAGAAAQGGRRISEEDMEAGTAKILAGVAKLEHDMLQKITKPLGAPACQLNSQKSSLCAAAPAANFTGVTRHIKLHVWPPACKQRSVPSTCCVHMKLRMATGETLHAHVLTGTCFVALDWAVVTFGIDQVHCLLL